MGLQALQRFGLRLPLLVFAVCLLPGCRANEIPVTIETGQGTLQGTLHDDIATFLGIPYAAAPIKDLRWKPPQPMPTWTGVRDATTRGNMCPQYAPFLERMLGNEDCLYLNVWAPHPQPVQNAPVMVWIHGGGFTAGQGAYGDNDGEKLARRTGNVVVSLNYRLGVFGFLAYDPLTEEDPAHPSSGNYGIEDQIAALRWVRSQIAAFGGDPGNVTIFGQSAGGVSVCALLASPLSEGLFQRAIVQSGPCTTKLSTASAASHEIGDKLAHLLGCGDSPAPLACMRARPASEVAQKLPPDPSFAFGEGYTVWWPILDGYVLDEQFEESFGSGRFHQVPVMIGSTQNEGTLIVMLSHDLLFKRLKAGQYPDRILYLMRTEGAARRVMERYPLVNYSDPEEALSDAFGDGFFNCPTRHIASLLAAHVPTYVYEFDFQNAPFFLPSILKLRAFHSAEVQYVFGNPFSLIPREFKGDEQMLSWHMMDAWGHFAATGDPNPVGTLTWPRYDDSDRHIIFDSTLALGIAAKKDACSFWQTLDYMNAPYTEPDLHAQGQVSGGR